MVSALLPGWSSPPAVNTPVATIVEGARSDDDVVMIWKCSVPEAAGVAALAAARPETARAAAVTAVLAAASSLVRCCIMVAPSAEEIGAPEGGSLPVTVRYRPAGVNAGNHTHWGARHAARRQPSASAATVADSPEHTSELQSPMYLV